MEKPLTNKTSSYLIFKIGNEEFGAHVSQVKNILELQEITKIPKTPSFMIGVVNLRGKALPIIDTRIKFDMTPTLHTSSTCIIVMDIVTENEIINIGALVDSVEAVREIDENIIECPPSIGNTYRAEFISGIATVDEHFIMLLELAKLFTLEELENLKMKK